MQQISKNLVKFALSEESDWIIENAELKPEDRKNKIKRLRDMIEVTEHNLKFIKKVIRIAKRNNIHG
jgi:hypothetical protein